MTSKNKYAKQAATEIRRNGHTVRTNRYLAFKNGWGEKLSQGNTDIWDKSNADRVRKIVDACSGNDERDFDSELALELAMKFPYSRYDAAEKALFKAEGLI